MKGMDKLLRDGKAMFLAYDQGLEHGPIEFNDSNVNPKDIISIAKKGKFTGVIFQKGIAEQYRGEIKKSGVPLIIKLNGKTNLSKGEPLSTQLCTVKEALKLGASAVGYTIYLGSEHEGVMFHEFAEIEREAHLNNIPVIVWIYPRGKGIEGKDSGMLLAYSARVALEIGADMVKLHWNGNKKDLEWAVKAAGKTKVVIAGGTKTDTKNFLKEVKDIMDCGVCGLAIGRNVWQAKEPLKVAEKVREIIWNN